ncbi:holin [Sporosarcina sp. P21c]|uniref:phage holin family protein n=1 Tax=Sporosarcina sp. P21c TaxID=2048255 RepID=UPI000C16A71F|nr:phage holin family protein [Sporosarcina sp. P21c]PIC88441.1 holin [Sporosarcina sp. P21c]
MSRMQVTGIKGIGALIASFTMYMMDIVNEALVVLVFLMLVDMITGVMRSFMTKSWNSTVGVSGIIKKVAVILLIGMAGAIEYMMQSVGQDSKGVLILGVTSFFILNEGISILENCAQLGLPIPPILFNALEKLHRDPYGKENQVARNPDMDRIDKVAIMKENEILQNELKKEKLKEDK